jgi:hypothetical protein
MIDDDQFTTRTVDEDAPPRRKRRHHHYDPVVRHRSAPGPAQVWVYILGQWRRVFDASDRAAAEKYAREQVRFGGGVRCIETRERLCADSEEKRESATGRRHSSGGESESA